MKWKMAADVGCLGRGGCSHEGEGMVGMQQDQNEEKQKDGEERSVGRGK